MATNQVVTITEEPEMYAELEKLSKVTFEWTSTDLGVVVDSVVDGQVNKTTQKFSGEIIRLITDPVDGPTDNYNATVLDDDGFDVLMGAGLTRDTTNTEQVLGSTLGCCYSSHLRLNITGAGDAKSGKLILYIK